MKLVSYSKNGHRSFGVMISAERFVDIRLAGPGAAPIPQTLDEGLREWTKTLKLGEKCLDALRTRPASETEIFKRALVDVQLEPPVSHPSNIIGIGLNYRDHCREQRVEPPKHPILFSKFSNSIIGPDGIIRWNRRLTESVDFEAELAVIIGRRAQAVPVDEAMEYIAGYTVLNDLSARDLQFGDKQWVRGKSLDTFCPMGPFLATRDEIGEADRLAIRGSVNGVIFQDSNTSEMIFTVPQLVAFITQGITLEPGDVIATGTPAGVGVFRKPPVFLKDGDEVRIWIEKIGELRNLVKPFDAELEA